MAPPDPPAWDTYTPDPSPDDEPAIASAPAPASATRGRRGAGPRELSTRARSLRVAILAGAAVVALGVPLTIAAVEDGKDALPTAVDGAVAAGPGVTLTGGGRPQTADGFADLVADIGAEFGTTQVFEAVIYPEYAVVDVPLNPANPNDERELSFYWDGTLSESSRGTSDYAPLDLAEIDGGLFEGLCDEARGLVEDPGVCYLIVRRPRPASDEGWLWAYVSNEFRQGGYINFDREGNEVRRTTW